MFTKGQRRLGDLAPPDLEAEFKVWYAAYPIHKKPHAAIEAFIRARRIATFEQLMAAINDGRFDSTPTRFIPHPASWLNAGCWKDEPDPIRPADMPKSRNGFVNLGMQAAKERYDAHTQAMDDSPSGLGRLIN